MKSWLSTNLFRIYIQSQRKVDSQLNGRRGQQEHFKTITNDLNIKDENFPARKAQAKIIALNWFVSYFNLSQCCV